jgi:thiopurine S-methyltransferase
MDNVSYWANRWEKRTIGWHAAGTPHPTLVKYIDTFLGASPTGESLDTPLSLAASGAKRVFFPLCGKTFDMAYLSQQGHHVTGMEGVLTAIQEFASDNQIALSQEHPASLPAHIKDNFVAYSGRRIRIYQGDFFAWPTPATAPLADLRAAGLADCYDAIFDRGSLVAINRDLRPQYVEIMDTVLAPGGKVLIAALDYDQSEMEGPPNALSLEQVKSLYFGLPEGKDRYTVELLSADKDDGSRFLKAHGGQLSDVTNVSILVTKRASRGE